MKPHYAELQKRPNESKNSKHVFGSQKVGGSSDGSGVREGDPQHGGRPHEPQVGAFYPLSVQYMFLKIF